CGWRSNFLAARISLHTRGHMTLRWPVAIVTIAAALGWSASAKRKYGLEPAAQFLFERNHTPTHCEQSQNSQTRLRLVASGSSRPAHNVQRPDQLDFSRAELPAFTMRLGPSMFEVSGNTADN